MKLVNVSLSDLRVNRANDRHGELANESAAIAWLFNTHGRHMQNLAKDIVKQGEIFEPPLVRSEKDVFTVYDGNRRVTCLKLLEDPARAPSAKLQEYFSVLRRQWTGIFPTMIECYVENNQARLNSILFRRHTGAQNGVGQSTWDDRMKNNFVLRTGQGGGLNVADEVEARLKAAKLFGGKKIPRSTMNRLFSAETFRNRLGFSVRNKRFEFTHSEDKVLAALARVAEDLANRRIVLGDLWDVGGKNEYLDRLEKEGILPSDSEVIRATIFDIPLPTQRKRKESVVKPSAPPKASSRTTLIPKKDYGILWHGKIQRHQFIWEELQFHLDLSRHRNAIAVLFRVLLELAVENYISQSGMVLPKNEKFSNKVKKVGLQLLNAGEIDRKQHEIIVKFDNFESLISADTFHRYVHSPNFSPSDSHLIALWDGLSDFISRCLKA